VNPAETTSTGILPDLMSELQLAADRAAKGIRDPEATRQACERMNRINEQIRQRHGVLDIGAAAIRELREAE
jgi:hypothetical protein